MVIICERNHNFDYNIVFWTCNCVLCVLVRCYLSGHLFYFNTLNGAISYRSKASWALLVFITINIQELQNKTVVLQANAIGRSAKTVREFLEKHYTPEVAADEKECIKLALKALLEVVQTGGKNLELATMKKGQPLKVPYDKPIKPKSCCPFSIFDNNDLSSVLLCIY